MLEDRARALLYFSFVMIALALIATPRLFDEGGARRDRLADAHRRRRVRLRRRLARRARVLTTRPRPRRTFVTLPRTHSSPPARSSVTPHPRCSPPCAHGDERTGRRRSSSVALLPLVALLAAGAWQLAVAGHAAWSADAAARAAARAAAVGGDAARRRPRALPAGSSAG